MQNWWGHGLKLDEKVTGEWGFSLPAALAWRRLQVSKSVRHQGRCPLVRPSWNRLLQPHLSLFKAPRDCLITAWFNPVQGYYAVSAENGLRRRAMWSSSLTRPQRNSAPFCLGRQSARQRDCVIRSCAVEVSAARRLCKSDHTLPERSSPHETSHFGAFHQNIWWLSQAVVSTWQQHSTAATTCTLAGVPSLLGWREFSCLKLTVRSES